MYNVEYGTTGGSVPLTSYEHDVVPEKTKRELSPEQVEEQRQARYKNLITALAQNRSLDPDSRITRSLQAEIALMVAEGFVLAEPKAASEKPKTIAPPAIKVYEPATMRELWGVPEKVPCPNCGELILPDLASHLRDLDNETCVLDLARIKRSGRFTAEHLAELVELSANVRKSLHPEQEPQAVSVFTPAAASPKLKNRGRR
jgi:hypothetical protein